jgi:Na+/H+ antiporter NhaD/arsenite permease-like protein
MLDGELLALKPLVSIIFILVYASLVIFKDKRPHAVWIAIATLFVMIVFYTSAFRGHVFQGIVSVAWEFLTAISWNVLGIFAGTLIIADLFIESRVPAWLADWFIARSKTASVALLWVCALSGFISAFVENVATVLIVAPIALAISQRLQISPVPFLIGIAISSNLQGTATLIGDPPSMIMAGFLSQRWGERVNFGFNEFFFFQGKPSIFFAVQIGAICAFIVLYVFFRKYKQPVVAPEAVNIESMAPTYILIGIILGLAVSTKFDPNFTFFGGMVCMIGALIALIWQLVYEGMRNSRELNVKDGLTANLALLKRYDIETTLFLAGIFIIVYLVEKVGLVTDIAATIQTLVGSNLFVTFIVIVWISVVLSAFIDNVPYIMVMLPVTAELGERISGPGSHACYVLAFGLLIGACLGGNCTPIGASANVVAIGLLKKHGYSVGFGEFMKIGVPFTVAATLAGSLFVWLVWQ